MLPKNWNGMVKWANQDRVYGHGLALNVLSDLQAACEAEPESVIVCDICGEAGAHATDVHGK